MSASEPTTVALDHNFPTPLLELLRDALPDVRLVAIRNIDVRLAEFSVIWTEAGGRVHMPRCCAWG